MNYKLSRLIKKQEIASILDDAVGVAGKPMDFWVCGGDGNLIASTPASNPALFKPELVKAVLSGTVSAPNNGFWAEPVVVGGSICGAVVGHFAADAAQAKAWTGFLTKQVNRYARLEMEKKDILQDSLEKYREINILYNMGERICPIFLDIDKMINHALYEAQKNLKAENGSIMLIDPTPGTPKELITKGYFGDSGIEQVRLKVGEGIMGAIALTGKAEIVNDVHADPRHAPAEAEIKNMLCLPLNTRDRVLGVINFFNTEQDCPFMSRDLKLMGTLATQLANAIENHYLHKENVEKERLKNNLSRYVSQKLVDTILHGESELGLGGVKKNVTVLFSDIRGFSSFSEGMDPHQLVEILNMYFTEMVEIVFKHDGTLDKFVGDMIMVVFGAPMRHTNDEVRAIRTAIDMQKRVRALSEEFSMMVKKDLSIGIGINSGEVVAGNIGSNRHMDYTVIGDTVNVAERLESQAKRGQILVSKDVRDASLSEFEFKHLGVCPVKGRQKAVDIYEVVE